MSNAHIIDIEAAFPQIPTQFDGDSGSAVPIANVLNINGLTVANNTNATPLFTTGSGNTIRADIQLGAALSGAPVNSNLAGIVSFDDTAFAVDANGFVTLTGGPGPAIVTNTGDDSVAVSPNGSGNFNWIGLAVNNATHAGKPIFFKDSTTANAIDLDIQVATERTAAPGDKNDAGICSFDDTAFAVDGDGYVTLVGGIAFDSFQVDGIAAPGVNPVVPDAVGLVRMKGVTISAHGLPVQSFSRAVNEYRLEVQLASAVASTNALQSGLAHFDSTFFTGDTNGFISLAASSFTQGSVIFWGASAFAEDNTNFFWDDTNNRLGIGTNSPIHDLEVQGHVGIERTADASDLHSLEIVNNAAGFGDFKAIDIIHTTGALSAGDEEAILLINIDETSATGGEIFALEVLTTTEGTDTVGGLKVGIGVDAVHQESGTFGNIDNVLNIAADVTAAVASGGAGNITMFVADNDTITMGDAAIWDETEVIIATPASGGGIQPVFAFSTGGANFTNFVPVDGTNGFRNTGVIDWDSGDLSGWATATSGRFEIRITRTRNSLSTSPIVDTLQLGAVTEFAWNNTGDVNLNSLTLVVPLVVSSGGTGLATITDHGIMLGSGTGAVTPLGVAGNGFLPIGSAGADPVLALLTGGTNISISPGAGSITINATGAASFNWAVETDATRALTVNQGVIGNRGTAQAFTLPTTAPVGSIIKVIQMGVGNITIDYDTNESIQFGSTAATTTTGTIISTAVGDAVELVCFVADTSWVVGDSMGNWTIT